MFRKLISILNGEDTSAQPKHDALQFAVAALLIEAAWRDDVFEPAERDQPFPPSAMRVIRGKTTGVQKKVSLPLGYLDDLQDATPPEAHEDDGGDGG